MSARYQNPQTSRWMSSDPAGWQLINPMDGEGNLRSGFSVVESVNWCSYTGNNPLKYTDPKGYAGEDEVTPTFFTQYQWTEDLGFEEGFSDNACAATTIMNAVSAEYTKQTGKVMTLEQGAKAMKGAIDNNIVGKDGKLVPSIRPENAFVNSWGEATSAMSESLGLGGSWSSEYIDGFDSAYLMGALGEHSNGEPRHFVNITGPFSYRDVSEERNYNTNSAGTNMGPNRFGATRPLYYRKD